MISMVTILICMYIVYVLANRILAVRIHIKYLILCGCCAFFINSIFPRIFVDFAGLTGTLGIVTIFIILSSYLIAEYYDNTMKKAAFETIIAAASTEGSEKLPADEKVTAEPAIHLTDRVEDTENELAVKEYCYPARYEEHHQCAALLESNNSIQQSNSENKLENTDFLTASVSKTYSYPVLLKVDHTSQQHQPEILPIITLGFDRKAEVFNNLMNFKKQKNILVSSLLLRKSIDRNAAALELEGSHSDLFSENINLEAEAMDEDCVSSLNDLDSLMDFAFSQKEQRDFPQALKAFRQALRLYPNSEVAPFLVMEIGTILKNLGSYNEAIKIFTEGRALIAVINNSTLEQEFINNIAYLRVVKNILIQNSLTFMPFNLIPENALKEINKEFSEWRSQS